MEINVKLRGLCPVLFDRYSGSNNEALPPAKKIYLDSTDGKTLVLPAINLMSFLSAQNTESAPQRIMGKRWRVVAKACQSYTAIEPFEIPFTRNGKPLTVDNAGIVIHKSVARVKKGALAVPNPKERPMLATPWELAFKLSLIETDDLREETLRRLFEQGGTAIGIGTFRGVFGKFAVEQWKVGK